VYPLGHVLERAVQLFPDRIAVVDGEKRFSYREFADRVHHLAGGLRGLGLNPGDRVALLEWNSHRYLEAYFACAHAGLVLMPINSRLAAPEVEFILRDSDARALLFSEPFLPFYEEVATSMQGLGHAIGLSIAGKGPPVHNYEDLITGAKPMRHPEPVDLSELALIYYTSGTTGEPKGVCLSHANMLWGSVDGALVFRFSRDDAWLHAGPLFHLGTSFAVWGMAMMGGTQHVMHFDANTAVDLMSREGITKTSLAGSMFSMLASQLSRPGVDLSSLRYVLYGGAPTPLSDLRRAATQLPNRLVHCYGTTETAGVVSFLPPSDHVFDESEVSLRRSTSVGQPTPFIKLRVVDEEGVDVGPGEVGEVICSGPKTMMGYWKKPKETAEALRDGWYLSGDMEFLDEYGYQTLEERKKDMIITGGENVYSNEVEIVLARHPGLSEVAVIGVPDDRWGEAVTAIIVGREGSTLSAEEVISFCRGKIAGYKIPKRVEIRTEPLPKSGSGKIAKRTLREAYWAGSGRKI